MASAPEKKPPITCHVLDTTIGKPGASIPVTLTCHTSTTTSSSTTPNPQFSATTNSDGRVTSWTPLSTSAAPFTEAPSLDDLWQSHAVKENVKWSLKFDTERYFGDKGIEAFFPEVEVCFVVTQKQREKKEHFHVPVLLGPFGYTTYRGS